MSACWPVAAIVMIAVSTQAFSATRPRARGCGVSISRFYCAAQGFARATLRFCSSAFAKRHDGIDFHPVPRLFQPVWPFNQHLHRGCLGEAEMHARITRAQIASVGVDAAPEGLLVFAEHRDSGADSVPIALHSLETNF